MNHNKKIHIETWGCQMNVADSERILALLAKENYARAESEHDANLIVLNTCHIREKAKHKVISRLGQLRNLKTARKDLKIAVVGCVAQAEGKKLISAAPYVDYVLGPSKLEQLPELLKHDRSAIAVGFKNTGNATDTTASPALSGRQEVSRFLNIMQGCNNYCTFCVVPYTRGPEKSVAMPTLVAQAKSLLNTGAKEITLLGQNVNSYGKDLPDQTSNPFVELLYTIGALPGLQRLRFTTSNPHDFSTALIKSFEHVSTLGRYTHLPVQSGSDVILQKMRRKTNVAQIKSIISALRCPAPDFAVSTDIIVGFPGETDDDFQHTVALVEDIRFSFIFAFKYSPRPRTPAARFHHQVPEEIKSKRLNYLLSRQKEITTEQNSNEIGNERKVLILYQSKKEPQIYYGRTDHFRLVRVFSQADIVGKMLTVKIITANATALVGQL